MSDEPWSFLWVVVGWAAYQIVAEVRFRRRLKR
jgi:hypothetical protein